MTWLRNLAGLLAEPFFPDEEREYIVSFFTFSDEIERATRGESHDNEEEETEPGQDALRNESSGDSEED